MTNPRFAIEDAYSFYENYIVNNEKQKLLKQFNFHSNGTVPFCDWELFAAILTGRKRRDGYGSDLSGFEVKSAAIGSGFEYQYHKHTGIQKLEDDLLVRHIFISYGDSYRDVEVRLVEPDKLKPFFDVWKPLLVENYGAESRRQRFRRSIPYRFVAKNGTVVFQIQAGSLITAVNGESEPN
jgi:hypothetical protein